MKKIKLFSNCIVVKGHNRSAICDIQREHFTFIPNALEELLTIFDGQNIDDIKQQYDGKYHEYIENYISFLIDNEFVFFTDVPQNFPKIDFEWDVPNVISNAILDISPNWFAKFKEIVIELDNLGCVAVQLRGFDKIAIGIIDKLLNAFEDKRILTIELFLKYDASNESNAYVQLLEKYKKISHLTIHSAPFSEIINIPQNGYGRIISSIQKIDSSSFCGLINVQNFVINYDSFIEAQQHNTCLNRKISIDRGGISATVRVCPNTTGT